MLDIASLNVSGLQGAYGATEQFLHSYPDTVFAFSKAMAEGVVLTKKDAAAAKRAIAKFVKVDDPKILDASYDAYASYLETNLAVRDDVIRSELDYLDEKEFPKARSAKTREFYDNTFIETLDKQVSSRRSVSAGKNDGAFHGTLTQTSRGYLAVLSQMAIEPSPDR